MERIWRAYTDWEDLGMWIPCAASAKDEMLKAAIQFTGDHLLYGSWMMRVLDHMPTSCEHNLTDVALNRRAWIGHAACYMAINCPEDITRAAWGMLSDEQRELANQQADKAIQKWEREHEEKNSELDRKMGIQRVLEWDTGRSAGEA